MVPVSLIFFVLSWLVGHTGGIFTYDGIHRDVSLRFALGVFIQPCLTEEFVFRFLLTPKSCLLQPVTKSFATIFFSSAVFVIAHPINAFFFNESLQKYAYDLHYLIIVFMLGVSCSIIYIKTASIWAPVWLHWVTVIVWLVFLGGLQGLNSSVPLNQ